jgi:hypothetical protein
LKLGKRFTYTSLLAALVVFGTFYSAYSSYKELDDIENDRAADGTQLNRLQQSANNVSLGKNWINDDPFGSCDHLYDAEAVMNVVHVHDVLELNAPYYYRISNSPGMGETYDFVVTYTSTGDIAPSYVRINIDGKDYDMYKQYNSDNTYTDGCVYTSRHTLTFGSHTYYFTASDGVTTTSTPTYSGPDIPFPVYIIVLIAVGAAAFVSILAVVAWKRKHPRLPARRGIREIDYQLSPASMGAVPATEPPASIPAIVPLAVAPAIVPPAATSTIPVLACIQCHFTFPSGKPMKFCPMCAAKQPSTLCQKCGFAFPVDVVAGFCPMCGEKQDGARESDVAKNT